MNPAWLALLLAAPRMNGIAVTPYSEQGLSFAAQVDEPAALGATHISVVVQWAQNNVASNQIAPHPKETQDEAVIRRLIRRARARGLGVMLFPIIWVERRGPDLWRGTLRPENPALWWLSYERFLMHFAELAREEGAEVLSVGSELASMETEEGRWRELIAKVRARFPGKLLYSANWDHFAEVPFWGALDLIGLTAYHRLTELQPPSQPDEAALREAWGKVRVVVLDWRAHHAPDRPLVFTEVGYPSTVGAAYRPWEHTLGGAVDLEAQRRCYAAFVDTWRDDPALAGVFFWSWWGAGGESDVSYTPRRKPAEAVLRSFFGARP